MFKRSGGLLLLATLTMLATAPAKADSVKFFIGGAGASGPAFTTNATSVYQAIQGNPTACPNGNCNGGNDVISTPQNFTSVGGQALTASAVNNVWADLAPPFAGLGVQRDAAGNTDQIDPGDLLLIHFASPVRLTGVATLFDDNHTPFGTNFPTNANITAGNTFLLNGVVTTFGDANQGALPFIAAFIGQDFTFQTNGTYQPSYYLSGLTFSAVPIPGAVWLFASGIAGIAALTRRRRKNQSTIAA